MAAMEMPTRALAPLRGRQSVGLPELVDSASQRAEGRLAPLAELALADFSRHLGLSAWLNPLSCPPSIA
ncbi:MAG: hypothetical protein DLM67_05925 [Candidatus Nephthysia bennettiae]|nr:MAG: hypothetical protein DLM67_05925 [Candidatus Dormibacteraeota bacterium]